MFLWLIVIASCNSAQEARHCVLAALAFTLPLVFESLVVLRIEKGLDTHLPSIWIPKPGSRQSALHAAVWAVICSGSILAFSESPRLLCRGAGAALALGLPTLIVLFIDGRKE